MVACPKCAAGSGNEAGHRGRHLGSGARKPKSREAKPTLKASESAGSSQAL